MDILQFDNNEDSKNKVLFSNKTEKEVNELLTSLDRIIKAFIPDVFSTKMHDNSINYQNQNGLINYDLVVVNPQLEIVC